MAEKRRDNRNFLTKLFRLLGVGSFIAAAALLILALVMQLPKVQARYQQYLDILRNFEYVVAALNNRWLIIVVIFLLYILRSLTPIYPYPALYIITGMVFEPRYAFVIDLIGMAFTVAFRYYTGIQMGESWMNAALKRHPAINSAFTTDGKNPWVLFLLRLVPVFPYNTVSQLYGSCEYPFFKYFFVSMLACLPKLISFTYVGYSVYDPLSGAFYIPLIAMFVLSGVSFFLAQGVYGLTHRITHKNQPDQQKGME